MFKIINNKKATTLTEILVAITILAVAALPIFGFLSYSNRGTREQELESEAGNLAKEEMNRLMYVISQDNLLSCEEGKAYSCTFSGNEEFKDPKGNYFKGFYKIYPLDNKLVEFKIPKLKFHNPSDCSTGAERHSDVVNESDMEKISLSELFPNATDSLVVDIYLEIDWRLPSETDYKPVNKLVLYGRRCFDVE